MAMALTVGNHRNVAHFKVLRLFLRRESVVDFAVGVVEFLVSRRRRRREVHISRRTYLAVEPNTYNAERARSRVNDDITSRRFCRQRIRHPKFNCYNCRTSVFTFQSFEFDRLKLFSTDNYRAVTIKFYNCYYYCLPKPKRYTLDDDVCVFTLSMVFTIYDFLYTKHILSTLPVR